jgi:precorrin-2 dehydrogenase/sirohydrochlorin ferrochelatase
VKTFYPAFLDLADKPVLVVGGGVVAKQKVDALIRAGARVTLVAPEALPALRKKRGLRWVKRPFRPGDVKGAHLAVAATDDEALNARVSAACRARGVWANVVDRPALCDFIVPAVTSRGPVTFAVSTGGASPALAKFLARRLEKLFGPETAAAARLLARLRPKLKRLPMAPRAAAVEQVLARAAKDRFSSAALARMERDILKILPSPAQAGEGAPKGRVRALKLAGRANALRSLRRA